MLKKYFDNAATGYIEKKTLEDYHAFADKKWIHYNPSSVSQYSAQLKSQIKFYRDKVLKKIGGKENDTIIFTSGGSEANNLAIKGWAFASPKNAYIYLSPLEHPSVIKTVEWLYDHNFIEGYTFIPVSDYGHIDVVSFQWMLEVDNPDNNFLVCAMMVNNETGVKNFISTIANITHKYKGILHVDAVQAIGHMPIDVGMESIDIMSVSGHKLGIPRGAGFLYIKEGVNIEPLIHGGHQEHEMRAGTENTLDIVAMCHKIENIYSDIFTIHKKEFQLFQSLIEGLDDIGHPYKINGSLYNRIYSIVNVTFEGIDNEQLITVMDTFEGYQISAGSACSSGLKKPSYVLQMMGLEDKQINNTVRISYNADYTDEDIMGLINAIDRSIKRIKAGGGT